ncbi:MAG: hypothetical protein WC054_00890 [Candidatus Nanopelagicales bacterium]
MELSTIRLYIKKPTDGSVSTRFWAVRVPFMLVYLFWRRGIVLPLLEYWWRLQWLLHRGDVESEYWMPVRNEVVTICSGDRCVVVEPCVTWNGRDSLVRRSKDGSLTKASWTTCMSPGWEDSNVDVG